MFSKDLAEKTAIEAIKSKYNSILPHIFSEIESAAKRGKFIVRINFEHLQYPEHSITTQNELALYLSKLGYKTEIYDKELCMYFRNTIEVSW